MTLKFSIFTLPIKFDCFGHFSKFSCTYEFYFWKTSPPPKYVFQRCFKSLFLIHSSARNSLKSAKNVVFFLILHFGRHANGWGGAIALPAPLPPWLRYWTYYEDDEKATKHLTFGRSSWSSFSHFSQLHHRHDDCLETERSYKMKK